MRITIDFENDLTKEEKEAISSIVQDEVEICLDDWCYKPLRRTISVDEDGIALSWVFTDGK